MTFAETAPTPSAALAIRLALLANAIHQSVLIALVPVLQQELGLGLGQLGLIVGLGLGVSMISMPVLAWRAGEGRTGRVLLWAVLGGGVSAAVLAGAIMLGARGMLQGAALFAVLLAARAAYGLSAPAVLPVAQALTGVQGRGGNVIGGLGRLGAIAGAGRILGSGMVAPLVFLGPAAPVLAVLPLYAAAALWLVPAGRLQAAPLVMRRSTGAGGMPRLSFLAVPFLAQGGIGMVHIAFGAALVARFGLGAEAASAMTGFSLMAASLAALAMQLLLIPRFHGRERRGRQGGAVLCLLGAGCALLPGAPWLLTAAAVLLAGGAALLLSANLALALDQTAPAGRGRLAGMFSGAQLAGLALGTTLAGFLAEISTTLPLWAAFLLTIAVVAFSAVTPARATALQPQPAIGGDRLCQQKGTSE
ncbi:MULTISPECIES: hypothetical protein [Actibacterium]|uniref:MFS transporter n=1 Tax=Actibacterium naphthalenivorans TaxID=1614693 RepID=A0A840C8E3_9RHOB|nr:MULTISPECIES: hypothetical protein [Actibacterium]MBB4020302.1 hypothetical protein [Actibacterium naphthalenivorans]